MTADQLITELFINHWLATTIFVPWLTLLYAWVTDQTWWWIGSILLMFIYTNISRSK